MNWTAIISSLGGALGTLLLGLVGKHFDFKKAQRKAAQEEEESDSKISLEKMRKTNDEWERMYHEQANANRDLKRDYAQLRNEMYELQKQVNDLNADIQKLNTGFQEKEKGYQLQIEALETENDELKEENEAMKVEIYHLRGGD